MNFLSTIVDVDGTMDEMDMKVVMAYDVGNIEMVVELMEFDAEGITLEEVY